MPTLLRICIVGLVLVCAQSASAGQKVYPKTEDALNEAFDKLNWEVEPKKYTLASSHGEYALPEGLAMLLGEEAKQWLFLNNGTEFPDADALVINPDDYEQLIFAFFESGYVQDKDWSDLDADLLLEGITENTEEANAERTKNGFGALEIIGWVQKPIYDETSRTAYWAIKANDKKDGPIINAIALKLGRRGFNKLIWVGDPDKFNPSDGLLMEAINNYEFEKGFRYADYSMGDKIAAVGLASLVAVSAGSKSGKGVVAGILATLLIFAKKLWFLIFLPFIFVWNWIKGLFTGKRE
jgi:uncharacterized membrane-anchored protein